MRHLLRFRLATLLTVVTLICVWLGAVTERVRNQKAALAALRRLGASVVFDHQLDARGDYDPDGQPPGPVWLRKFIGDEFFQSVATVRTYDSPLTGTDVEKISSLETLEKI